MAFNIDPSISLNVKGPQQYTLPDLLNIATSAQAYKQRQQLNPLEIQKAQQDLDVAKLDNMNKHLTSISQSTADLMLKDDLTSNDIINRAKEINRNIGGNDQTEKQFLTGLPINGSQKDLKAWLAQAHARTLTSQAQLEKLYPAGILPGQQPNVSYEENKNPQQNVVQNPQDQNQPANVQSNVVQQNTPNQGVTQDQMNKPTYSQPEGLPYAKRTATTVTPYGPTEKADQDEGFKIRNALVNRQSTLTTDRRNIDEVISKAKNIKNKLGEWGTGYTGAFTRWLNTAAGTELGTEYKTLAKDLANAQISNIQAKGGSLDTVEGQKLQKMASGDETFPPDTLLDIAGRAKADMTELDKKANGAQRFAEKFGDNNMKKFQQEWQKNADSKIFELYNVFNDPNMTDQEKKAYRDKILPKDAKQRKIFQEKWNNIQKLESTGSL